MKKEYQLIGFSLLLPAVLLLVCIITQGPRYEGRTSSQWFDRMKMTGESPELDPGLKGLKSIGEPAVKVLQRSLKSPETVIKFRAAWALGQLGPVSSNAVPDLIKTLQDPDVMVQIAALQALTRIGTSKQDLVPSLIAKLKHPNLQLSGCAGELLNRIESERKRMGLPEPTNAVERALSFLDATSPYARVLSLPNLLDLSLQGRHVGSAYEALLNDSNAWVREETVKVLRQNMLPEEKLIPLTPAANFSKRTWPN